MTNPSVSTFRRPGSTDRRLGRYFPSPPQVPDGGEVSTFRQLRSTDGGTVSTFRRPGSNDIPLSQYFPLSRQDGQNARSVLSVGSAGTHHFFAWHISAARDYCPLTNQRLKRIGRWSGDDYQEMATLKAMPITPENGSKAGAVAFTVIVFVIIEPSSRPPQSTLRTPPTLSCP